MLHFLATTSSVRRGRSDGANNFADGGYDVPDSAAQQGRGKNQRHKRNRDYGYGPDKAPHDGN
jgi:hypothetical protein